MARESTITQEQVNAAADTIRASGAKPTLRAVREHLGSGSMATVLKLLQVWQSGQIKPAAQDITLPAGIQRQLVDFVSQEVSSARAELESDLVSLQQSQADLIAENERQSRTIEIQAESVDSLTAEKAGLTGRLAQIESDLTRSVEEVAVERAAAERARTELAKAQLRLEAVPHIEAEIKRLRDELAIEAKARTAAEQSAAVLAAELKSETRRAAESEVREKAVSSRLAEIEQQARATVQELGTARVQVQAQQTALDAAAREIDAGKKTTAEAKAEAKKSAEESAELRGRLTQLEKAVKPATK